MFEAIKHDGRIVVEVAHDVALGKYVRYSAFFVREENALNAARKQIYGLADGSCSGKRVKRITARDVCKRISETELCEEQIKARRTNNRAQVSDTERLRAEVGQIFQMFLVGVKSIRARS